jgi:alpha-L-fucosidase
LKSPEAWESVKLNSMIRELQPHILINDRSQLPEDFGTPEEHVTAAKPGRNWEACMTFNGSWGYMPISPDWRSVREVITMLNTAAAGGGNLLLNIGPAPDGSIPPEAVERLEAVGKWVETAGE